MTSRTTRRREDADARWIRQHALIEMRHRSVGAGFRSGKISGAHPSDLRERAHRDARRDAERIFTGPQWALVGAASVGAFFLARHLARQAKEKRAADSRGTYVQGLDALSL